MPKISSGEKSIASAPALRRAVQIIDLVSGLNNPPTFTDIVTSLGLPKSSVHGLCATLVELGLLHRSDAGTYLVGSHTLSWAKGFLRQTNIEATTDAIALTGRDLMDISQSLSARMGNRD